MGWSVALVEAGHFLNLGTSFYKGGVGEVLTPSEQPQRARSNHCFQSWVFVAWVYFISELCL